MEEKPMLKALKSAIEHIEHMAKFITNRGYSLESLNEDIEGIRRAVDSEPAEFLWLNRKAIVRGEDFSYEATVLCSFPKTNGKIRYIVEDNGRLFIQRKDQITFKDDPELGWLFDEIKDSGNNDFDPLGR